ncbi:MAG: ATP-binding protein [Candidatus Sphingomonas phytovorans]|nr:ATP-binding protein [Sphingomonas sp.]WEK01162.1 MAG: ATP-binding protein [Sphingomonas sp.]
MKTPTRPREWPLFARIFVLMLLMVLLVQTLNFVLVLIMPFPAPRVQPIARIASALRSGTDPGGTLRIFARGDEPRQSRAGRDLRLSRRMEAALALPPHSVRVESLGPGPFGLFSPFERDRARPRSLDDPSREGAGDDLIFGAFRVSIKLANGTWRSVEPLSGGFDPWRWRALLWLIVAILVVAPFAWVLARRLVRPIRLFATAAERLGRDPQASPLLLVGPSELAEAAVAFNEMQARLNKYVEGRTTMIGAIAHDLRTPLMRLAMRLEHAPANIRIAAENDIEEMDHRISAAMAYVRDTMRPARRRKLDLRSLAESVTDEFADRGHQVVLAPGEPVVIEGDAPGLKALLANLISNAVKYGGSALVNCHVEGAFAIVEVIDSGPGMNAGDLENAFEPFFRAERSRGRETGGIGLGLASVRAVAGAHGGEAILENRPEGGMKARVALPL